MTVAKVSASVGVLTFENVGVDPEGDRRIGMAEPVGGDVETTARAAAQTGAA